MYTLLAQNGRVPLDVRETCRELLFYLRKRPELLKEPSPKGFKVRARELLFQRIIFSLSKTPLPSLHNTYSLLTPL